MLKSLHHPCLFLAPNSSLPFHNLFTFQNNQTFLNNMTSDQTRASTSRNDHEQEEEDDDHELIIRDIHALTPPPNRPRQREAWETSSSLSMTSSENFTTLSREFNALVIAGTTLGNNGSENEGANSNNNLGRIGEEEMLEETNPLAIVPDNNPMNPVASPRQVSVTNSNQSEVTVQRVKKEEVESKISAWQNSKIAKINNRFKREDAVINGWEGEQVQKSTSWMKKVERKLEEKRAKAMEKMQNNIARARRKAEERRATAEGKKGTKVARVFEIANLMRAVARAPTKRSFF